MRRQPAGSGDVRLTGDLLVRRYSAGSDILLTRGLKTERTDMTVRMISPITRQSYVTIIQSYYDKVNIN